MSEKAEITFMQTRLIRLASEEWHLPIEQIIYLFKNRIHIFTVHHIAPFLSQYNIFFQKIYYKLLLVTYFLIFNVKYVIHDIFSYRARYAMQILL